MERRHRRVPEHVAHRDRQSLCADFRRIMNPEDAPLRTSDVRDDFANSSDAALVVAIGRYKQAALAEAYRRHAGAVFGLAKRLLLDSAQAEEIVQEVFLRL